MKLKLKILLGLIAACNVFNIHCAERVIFIENKPLFSGSNVTKAVAVLAPCYAAYRMYSNWSEGIDNKRNAVKKELSAFTTNHAPQFYLAYDYEAQSKTYHINIWLENKQLVDIFSLHNHEANKKFFEEVKTAVAKHNLYLLDYNQNRQSSTKVRQSNISPELLILSMPDCVRYEGQKIFEFIKEKYSYLLDAFKKANKISCLEVLMFDDSFNEKLQSFEKKTIIKKTYSNSYVNKFFEQKYAEENEKVSAFCKLVVMYMKLCALEKLLNDVKNNLVKYGIEPRRDASTSVGGISRPIGMGFPDYSSLRRDLDAG